MRATDQRRGAVLLGGTHPAIDRRLVESIASADLAWILLVRHPIDGEVTDRLSGAVAKRAAADVHPIRTARLRQVQRQVPPWS